MNALFISSNLARLDSGGGKLAQRNLALFQNLSKGSSVEIFALSADHCLGKAKIERLFRKFFTLLFGVLGFTGGLNPSALIKLSKAIIKSRPQIVVLDGSSLGLVALIVKIIRHDAKIITFAHNVEFDYILQRSKVDGIIYLLLALPVYISEFFCILLTDLMVALHDADKNRFVKLYGRKKIELLPLSLQPHDFLEENALDGKYFLFVGSNFYGNISGLRWLCQNVMPYSRHSLLIIGKDMEAYSNELNSNNVRVLGYVENLCTYYLSAAAVLCPIFMGAGMKVKTIEALKYGRYIIATPHALNGLSPNVSWCSLCETAQDFLHAMDARILELEKNNNLLIKDALDYFVENFADSAIERKFLYLIKNAGLGFVSPLKRDN